MTKIIKKILCCSLLLVCVLCLAFAGGCSCDSEEELTLNFTQTTIEIGDRFTVVAKQQDGTIVRDLEYKSSDENIVTVNEKGVVLGERMGTAEVTAFKEGASATLSVTVVTGDEYPTVLFNNISNVEDSFVLHDDMKMDLSSKIFFKQNYYEDLTLSFTLSDESVGKIENNVFTPNPLGDKESAKTTVLVTAEWRGYTTKLLYKEIEVEVIKRDTDYAYFKVNGNHFLEDVELYSLNNVDGDGNYPTEHAFTYTLYLNGKPYADTSNVFCTVENVTNDYQIAEVKNGKIIAKAGGQAEVALKYVVNGKVLAKLNTVVKVTVPHTTKNFTVDQVSALDGITVPDELFGTGEKVLRAVQNLGEENQNDLEVIDGVSFGLNTINTGWTDTKVTFFTKTKGYTVDVKACTKILTKESDIDSLELNDAPQKTIDGYYFLGNDIVMNGGKTSSAPTDGSVKGFIGTFDGNGKTITVKSYGRRYGLFQVIGKGGTIKNVGFKVEKLVVESANAPGYQYPLLAYYVNHGATISNVAINYTPPAKDSKGNDIDPTTWNAKGLNMIAYRINEEVAVKDIYVYIDERVPVKADNRGLLGGYLQTGITSRGVVENVYAVSKNLKEVTSNSGGFFAQNELDANVGTGTKMDGVFRYDTVADMATAGVTKVGSWLINVDGTFTYDA